MSFWSAIVTIVIIACLTGIVMSWIDAQKTRGQNRDDLDKRIGEIESEFRDRVQTLERIVTDERSDLKRQFDDLEKRA